MTFLNLQQALRHHLPDASVFVGLDPQVNFEPWNPTTAEWPLARVECRSAAEVAVAIRIAADCGVPVSVCGGREDIHGRNSRSGHLVVDLRRMMAVKFDGQAGVVSADGAVTAGRMLAALPESMAVPTTINANVGVIGAATGGGYGGLCGSFGLTCDALLGAELVLADGRLIVADANNEPDLFWALRGGGTGFGVVTRARFAAHSCSHVLAAQVTLPLAAATKSLLVTQTLIDAYPISLGPSPLFIKDESGTVVLMLFATWHGSEAAGHKAFAALQALPGATFAGGNPVPYRETLDDGAIWPWGKNWAADTRTLDRLTPAVVDALAESAAEMPLPGTVLFLHDFHGWATQVAPESTAFSQRRDHYVATAAARWEPGDWAAAEAQRSWVEGVKCRLAPLARPGGYVNFLAPSDFGRVHDFYGSATAQRLVAIKTQYDPHDLFRSASGRLSKQLAT